MKILPLAILGSCAILIPLLGWLPWQARRSETQAPARFNFLLVLGIAALAMIFSGSGSR